MKFFPLTQRITFLALKFPRSKNGVIFTSIAQIPFLISISQPGNLKVHEKNANSSES